MWADLTWPQAIVIGFVLAFLLGVFYVFSAYGGDE